LSNRKGLTLILTGEGKGKTTSAVGQAVRARGHGQRVLFIQFMKGRDVIGEVEAVLDFGLFDMVQFGRTGFVNPDKPLQEDFDLAGQGFKKAKDAVQRGKYDLIVLDEILGAVHIDLIKLEDVKFLIQTKPDNMHLILTGRDAHPDLVEMADLVSEVHSVKHPFDQGIGAQEGIEY